jgi:hypothetical protein
VNGRKINVFVAIVERYWKGKTEIYGEKYYKGWVVDEKICVKQLRNDTESRKLKYLEKNNIRFEWFKN